jgi:hypothetical protein
MNGSANHPLSQRAEAAEAAGNAASLARLLDLLGRMAGLAAALLRKVRFALLLALLSAVWLTFYLQHLLGLEWVVLAVVLGVLGMPALVLAYGYVVLQGVMELPEMTQQIGVALQDAASPLWGRLRGMAPPGEGERKGGALRRLWRMAGILLELSRLGALPEAARTALAIANPLFITLLAVAYGTTLILALLAAITGMVYIS